VKSAPSAVDVFPRPPHTYLPTGEDHDDEIDIQDWPPTNPELLLMKAAKLDEQQAAP